MIWLHTKDGECDKNCPLDPRFNVCAGFPIGWEMVGINVGSDRQARAEVRGSARNRHHQSLGSAL
jgi:hypothetical protein